MTYNTEKPSATNTGPSNIHIPSQHVEHDISPLNGTKQCKTCNKRKPVSEFAKNTKTNDGYLKTCLACSRSRNTVKRSLRSAINDKCKECIYDPIAGGGTWRFQVSECTIVTCPLFDHRPTPRGYGDDK